MRVFLIHDPLRTDREVLYKKELETQGITDYILVPADKSTKYPVINIARAHKDCIRRALEEDLPQVVVMEDDVRFVAPGAYNRFLELFTAFDRGYEPWDLFISGSYEYTSDGKMPISKLQRFSGLHCYMIHRRFYEKFLALPEKINLDKEISRSGAQCWLAYPMLCLQHTTKSDNTNKTINYDQVYKEKIKEWRPEA